MANTTVYTNNQYYQNIAAAIRSKNGQSTLYKPSEMGPAINALVVSGESVNNQTGGGNPYDSVVFYDYDGSIVASYSKAEFTAMPENPTHEGLVAQGWNWTKAQIDDYLNNYPEATVNVGQMYITDDGKTRLYVHFEEGRTSPYLGLGVDGTVEVDWGDGSATDTLTGTSESTLQTIQHIYQSGDYVITLTPTSGSFSIFGTFATSYILTKSEATASSGVSAVYTNALKKVELGLNAVIGSYAFQNCYSLSSITIPDSVTSIGSYAFCYCYLLSSITIPNSVTSISTYAFHSCFSLSSITIPSGVTSIDNAFYNCFSLSSITIPDSVTSINSAFNKCHSLSSTAIPSGVTSIGSYTFYYCYLLSSITIPDSVTNIDSNAFSYCNTLSSIIIPGSVTSIGSYAFQNCSSLSLITISNGVSSISSYAFQNCYSLSLITIPGSVTSIGSYAFANCYGMHEYHFLSITPPTLVNKNAFSNIPSDCVIYVPSASVEAYKAASKWSNYASQIQGE